MTFGRVSFLLFCGLPLFATAVILKAPPKGMIEFNRDIRPIISKCLTCHGHDPQTVAAGLRLDVRDSAIGALRDGKHAIVPGKPDESEMIRRIYSKDPDEQMPPPDSNKVLNDDERRLLRQWVEEGAEYKEHWGFVAPTRPAVPAVKLKNWPKAPIDNFILARLEEEGLQPSPQADRGTLIRRVSLDLTGIPPTPAEVDAFLKDKSPNAYEKVVDRLLASPRYGERMAMDWLDYARYADSNGYQADYERFMWRWRDWVIEAYNHNMPFDQFTLEQIAGDLLPNATLSQKIATGFNRNHRINTEGGVIAEEWRVETVIDRVEASTQTWLGLTAACARCHDHKYDPITQKEFYGLFAYFNNVPESGTGEERPVNHPPFVKAPTPAQQREMANLDSRLTQLTPKLHAMLLANAKKSTAWKPAVSGSALSGRLAQYTFEGETKPSFGTVPAPKPTGDVTYADGALALEDGGLVDLGDIANWDKAESFSYALWINPKDGKGAPISRMDVASDYRGWDMFLEGGRPALHLVSKWPDNAIKVISRTMIPNGKWSHVAVTYDGSAKAAGVHIYVDGKEAALEVEADSLAGSTKSGVTLKLGRRTNEAQFTGMLKDLGLYSRALSATEVGALVTNGAALAILSVPEAKRTKEQSEALAHLWSRANDPAYRKLDDEKQAVSRGKDQLDAQISTVMVMEEMAKPRPAYVLVRGEYDKHGEEVPPTVPKALPPLPAGVPNNRLGFAKWVIDPGNPLTARVLVNRMWERLYGVGIVATSEDFGTRAEFPSHPELLDWLATEIVRLKWNQKAVWKELVMSATYQQASKVTPELLSLDPANRLLARGPRFRLNAEVIRDQALAAAGLLVDKQGGPSVRPYQPDGVWDELNVYGNLRNYKHDKGEGLYRRSLYTIWKRTAAPPEMTLFDASTRETCRVRRSRTNTPLQALALLNDVTYVEAARALAMRMLQHGGATADSRLRLAYRATLARDPEPEELTIIKAALAKRIAGYQRNPEAAKKLIAQGDLPNDPKLDPVELAAYTTIASTILNLDEVLTKE